MTAHVIGSPSQFPEGQGVGVDVDGLPIAVFRIDGKLDAVQNRCPHKGGPLYRGDVDVESCAVHCPWHRWKWDLKTGRFAVDPRQRLRTFDVREEGSDVVIEL